MGLSGRRPMPTEYSLKAVYNTTRWITIIDQAGLGFPSFQSMFYHMEKQDKECYKFQCVLSSSFNNKIMSSFATINRRRGLWWYLLQTREGVEGLERVLSWNLLEGWDIIKVCIKYWKQNRGRGGEAEIKYQSRAVSIGLYEAKALANRWTDWALLFSDSFDRQQNL